MKKVLVIGGAGYVGASLVPKLLNLGWRVSVLDLMIYGENVLDRHPSLKIYKGDIRDIDLVRKVIAGHDYLIHLACISNDPSFELNPLLGKSINLDSFEPIVQSAKNLGIKRFIYASSSSVYGIKNEKNVHEEMELEPLTDYSKFKAECEIILNKYTSNEFTTTILRPATVCGYSPRQRLDVVVNILTNLAFHKRKITVLGGEQLRPNIHIKDMVNAYVAVLEASKDLVSGEIFNVGTENRSVKEIAEIVKTIVGEDVQIQYSPTNDNRSYHISSEKILKKLNFNMEYSISQAVKDLSDAFKNRLLIDTLENEMYFNIKRMQKIALS